MSASPVLVATSELAALLGLKPQTVRLWRLNGKGPVYIRLGEGPGARVAYRRADVDRWISEHAFANTAAESQGRPARPTNPLRTT